MIWRKRSELRPGEMFVIEQGLYGRGHRLDDVMVVIDSKLEIGFWRGGKYCCGDLAPGVSVLVL